MIFPSLRPRNQPRETIIQYYKHIRSRYSSDNRISSITRKLSPKSQLFPSLPKMKKLSGNIFQKKPLQKAYKGYSKSKNTSFSKQNNDYFNYQQNEINIQEYSITPEFLNSMKLSSKNFKGSLLNQKRLTKVNFSTNKGFVPHKVPYEVFTKCLGTQKRKVILSKTPDP